MRHVGQPLHVGVHDLDEQRRRGGRGLHAGVRDVVGDRTVRLVTDPGQDGDRHLGDGARDDLGVEGREVAARAAAPNDHDDVELLLREASQCPHEPARRRGPLHSHVAVRDSKRVAGGLELVDKVSVRGAAAARHQPDPQRNDGHAQRRVAAEHTFGRQHAQDPIPVGGQPPHGERRVDRRHDQLQPSRGRPEVHPGPDSHLDAVGEPEPGVAQRSIHAGTVVAEERDADRGADLVSLLVLLDELEVGVLIAGHVQRLHFASHPHRRRERLAERAADRLVELGDTQGRLCAGLGVE